MIKGNFIASRNNLLAEGNLTSQRGDMGSFNELSGLHIYYI